MHSIRLAKEVKKGSTSPLKTPEKPRVAKKPPAPTKSPMKTKLTNIVKKASHNKSLSQMAIIEELKQTSVSLVEGFEKLRRIVAFSRYKYCFEIMKARFIQYLQSIQGFVDVKRKLKAWEVLKSLKTAENSEELEETISEYARNEGLVPDIGKQIYEKKLKERGLNGIMRFYCQSVEISEIVSEFREKKIKRRAFEGIYMHSQYDEVVSSFIKLKYLPKILKAWRSLKL